MIYCVRNETIPNEVEQEAIACFNVLCDRVELTRSQTAKFLKSFDGIGYIHIGGHHVSINRDNCRVAVITSNHPDWN